MAASPAFSDGVLQRLADKAAARAAAASERQDCAADRIPALRATGNSKAAPPGELPGRAAAGVEMMTVRVLANELEDEAAASVRVELSCEASLFFHYAVTITPDSYDHIAVRYQRHRRPRHGQPLPWLLLRAHHPAVAAAPAGGVRPHAGL